MKKIIAASASVVLSVSMVAPLIASAQGITATADVHVSTGSTTSASVSTTAEGKARDRADQEITRRKAALNVLITRISAMEKLSGSQKASLTATLSAEISALDTLKAKIDADTVLATLKTDVQSITKDYRVFMLVMPMAQIAASADRIQSIADQFNVIGTKLQARMAADTTGNASTSMAAYADMQVKLADAVSKTNAIVSETISLTPDNGDKKVAQTNTAALKDARTKIQEATKDLQAARKDIQTIMMALKVSGAVTASSTAWH